MSGELETWERQVPRLVSAVGSVGLGLALAYVVGLGVFLWPGGGAWGEFFLVWAPVMALAPAVALGVHLYARMHLGGWFLERGAPDEAIAYTEDRLEHGFFQGAREVGYHRLYRARAHIAKGAYERARELLEAVPEGEEVKGGRLSLSLQRWRCELALRERDGERCRAAVEAVEEVARPAGERAALAACRAEQALLDEEFDTYQSWLDEARWSEGMHWRADLTEAFGRAVFEHRPEALGEALEWLDEVEERANRQVPGRRVECLARRAQLLIGMGREERARDVIARADADAEDRADERARSVLDRVASKLRGEEESSSSERRD